MYNILLFELKFILCIHIKHFQHVEKIQQEIIHLSFFRFSTGLLQIFNSSK